MAVANRAQHQLRSAPHAVAPARGFNIFVHGVATKPKDLGNLPIALTLGHERDALDLARTEGNENHCPYFFAEQFARPVIGDRTQQPGSENFRRIQRFIA